MPDLAQRVASRLKPKIASEPDEWYPTREQERQEYEEYGCLGPDGNECPRENLAEDQSTRLCEECDAAIEATSLQEYVPWDELEEHVPQIYDMLDKEFKEVETRGGGTTDPKYLENFPEVVDAAQKLREVLLHHVEQAKQKK
jgi:hypothetical protein